MRKLEGVPDRGRVIAACAVINVAVVVFTILLVQKFSPGNNWVSNGAMCILFVAGFPLDVIFASFFASDICAGFICFVLSGCFWGWIISLVWEFIAEERIYRKWSRDNDE